MLCSRRRVGPSGMKRYSADSIADANMPFVEIERVAKLVLYLCSDAGEIVNGASWTADAGVTAS